MLRRAARFATGWSCAVAALSCDPAPTPRPAASATPIQQQPVKQPPAKPPPARRPLVLFQGACDASGAVPLDERRFAVADDEDSVLRIYDAERGGPPLYTVDVSAGLDLAKKPVKPKDKPPKKPSKKPANKPRKPPETDIEAASVIGERAYWITSHARTKSGKRNPARFKFFATPLPRKQGSHAPVEGPYSGLVDDMLTDPRLAGLGLAEAAERSPTDGGLNIEGMTATPDGKLLLGLRQPVPQNRAVVLTLENPDALLRGEKARFGSPQLLDLGGLGVRALSWWRGSYLIVAGPPGATGPTSRLYRWDGAGSPTQLHDVRFDGLNPEGFFTPETRDAIVVLSDDGAQLIGGTRCKDLKLPEHKRFRGLWLDLAPAR